MKKLRLKHWTRILYLREMVSTSNYDQIFHSPANVNFIVMNETQISSAEKLWAIALPLKSCLEILFGFLVKPKVPLGF